MADRYWVGGTDTWNATAGSKWSTTSGGAGGASVPGVNDSVFFTATGSPYTVTISGTVNCLDFNVPSGVGVRTFAGTQIINVYRNYNNQASDTVWSHTGIIQNTGTNANTTWNSSGIDMSCIINFSSSGTCTLQSDCKAGPTQQIRHVNGTIDTNGYSLDAGSFLANYNTTTRALYLRTGTHTFRQTTSLWNINTTNYTIYPGTSTVSFLQNATITLNGTNTLAFNSMHVSNANSFRSLQFLGDIGATIDSLAIEPATNDNATFLYFTNNMAIRIMSVENFTTARRPLIIRARQSPITLSVNSWPEITDRYYWFSGINLTGTASGQTATNGGDMGQNSGIIFPASRNLYWNRAANASWWADNVWAATSGGSTSASNIPRPQDNVFIGASGNSIAANQTNWGSFCYCKDFTTGPQVTSLNLTTINVTGNASFNNNKTVSGTMIFFGRGTQTLYSDFTTMGCIFNIQTLGDFELASDVTLSNNIAISLVGGTNIKTNNYNLRATLFSVSGSAESASNWYFGSSTITLVNPGATFNLASYPPNSGGLTIDSGTSTIKFSTGSAGTVNFYPQNHSLYNVEFDPQVSGVIYASSQGATFNNISRSGTTPFTWNFTSNGAIVECQSFTVTGYASNALTIQSTATNNVTFRKPSPWNVGVNSTATSSTGLNLVAGHSDYINFTKVTAVNTAPQGGSLFFGNNF